MRYFVFAAALLASGLNAAHSETVKIAGSTTLNSLILEPYRSEIEAISGHNIDLVPNRTIFGLQLLIEGRSHIAMVATPLEDTRELVRRLDPRYPLEKLGSLTVYRTRTVFSVNRNNPIRFAKMDQVKGILLGKITNWKDLGGTDIPIKVVLVKEGGSSELSVRTKLLDRSPIYAQNIIRVQQGSQVNTVVEQELAALGLAQVQNLKTYDVRELVTEDKLEQELNLVWIGQPSDAILSVIEAIKQVAKASPDPK